MYLRVTMKEGMVKTMAVHEILQGACTMRRAKRTHSPGGINVQGVTEEGDLLPKRRSHWKKRRRTTGSSSCPCKQMSTREANSMSTNDKAEELSMKRTYM